MQGCCLDRQRGMLLCRSWFPSDYLTPGGSSKRRPSVIDRVLGHLTNLGLYPWKVTLDGEETVGSPDAHSSCTVRNRTAEAVEPYHPAGSHISMGRSRAPWLLMGRS